MDYRLILQAIINIFPAIGDSIKWIRQHIRKYEFKESGSTLTITIEFTDKKSMEQALRTIKPIIEGILG